MGGVVIGPHILSIWNSALPKTQAYFLKKELKDKNKDRTLLNGVISAHMDCCKFSACKALVLQPKFTFSVQSSFFFFLITQVTEKKIGFISFPPTNYTDWLSILPRGCKRYCPI